ncbi:MAG: hypothetical protein E7507_02765 [Ruminococcus sp.]|nr:hypothetical protein [Ruminococcus sp.]
MKKLILFPVIALIVAMATACTGTEEIHYTENARAVISEMLGGNYYISETATYEGSTTVTETMIHNSTKYCRMTDTASDVRVIASGSDAYIIDEISNQCTVQTAVNDDIFNAQGYFLEAVFSAALDGGTFVDRVVNDSDKTAYETYSSEGTLWRFHYNGDALTKIENLENDGTVIAVYEYSIEPSTFYAEKIAIDDNKYTITDKRQ